MLSACLLYGFLIEPRGLKIRTDTVVLSKPLASPLKIVVLADIHIGGFHVPATRVPKIVKAVNAQSPDLILIAGDFIHGHIQRGSQTAEFNQEIEQGLSSLAELKSRLGTFTVIGNHDVWYDYPYVQSTLEKAGLIVLHNDYRRLPGDLCVAGFADHDTQVEDPRVTEGCDRADIQLAVMHSPDSFKILSSTTDLAVAGHTHGGQINLPVLGRHVTSTDLGPSYAYGRAEMNGVPVWITAGIGTSILPARFRAPPEIVVLTLRGQGIQSIIQAGQ